MAAFVDKLAMGTATPEDMLAAAGPRLQFPTIVRFAGDDLRTVHADRPSHMTRPGRGRGPCAGAGADLARSEELTGAMARLVEASGRVDVLVNAAGTDMPGPVAELAVEDWDRVQAVNLRAPFVLSKAVLPHMRAAGTGRSSASPRSPVSAAGPMPASRPRALRVRGRPVR